MKRFLMYLVVAIVLVSCGFSIYYVVRDDETIYSYAENKPQYINLGETLKLPIERRNPSDFTNFYVKDAMEAYVDIDMEKWTITAKAPGTITLTFVTDNKNIEKKEYDITYYVGNGSPNNPYYIRNFEDLVHIGKDGWLMSDHYALTQNINAAEMLPIGVNYDLGVLSVTDFTGSLRSLIGNRYAISGAKILQGDLDYPVGGLFGIIGESGVVENIIIENIIVDGYFNYAGSVSGVNHGKIGMLEVRGATINNLNMSVSDKTTGEQGSYTGGITGLNQRLPGSDYFAQINICQASDIAITAHWVAGGIVGYNYGGVVFNCLIKVKSVSLNVAEDKDATYSYFGGMAGISNCGVVPEENGEKVYYDSFVSNSIVYISNVASTTSHIAGIFGAYYGISQAYQSEGNYNMLFYVSNSDMPTYYICDDDQVISDDKPSAQNYAKRISAEEALLKSTYTSIPNNKWDFNNVWEIEGETEIRLGFVRFDGKPMIYQAFPANGEVIEIASNLDLKDALTQMRSKPSKTFIYKINANVTFDGKKADFEPIGDMLHPFAGQFVAGKDENGNEFTITIKNVNINSEYAGVFGVADGNNTIIKNIILENVLVTGDVAGALVGYNKGATIENCRVLSYEIKTSKYAGGITGINKGTIKNCLLTATEEKDESGEIIYDELTGKPVYKAEDGDGYIEILPQYSANMYLGGVAGRNYGTIDNIIDFKTDIRYSGSSSAYVGGIVGQNQGNINDVEINNLMVKPKDDLTKAYVGGIVGHQSAGSIKSAFVNKANNIERMLSNTKSVVGGIAGYIAQGSDIMYSVVNTMTIYAYNAGGFAGIADGDIKESYITDKCSLTGSYVGGFTGSLRGNISNCMTIGRLNGAHIQAGMTVYLRKGSKIENCYINTIFDPANGSDISDVTDAGKLDGTYAETASKFRANPDQFGKIENCVIIGKYDPTMVGPIEVAQGMYIIMGEEQNQIKAKVQTAFHVWLGDEVNVLDKTAVLGSADQLKEIGFLESVWNMADNPDGLYLIPTRAAYNVFLTAAS